VEYRRVITEGYKIIVELSKIFIDKIKVLNFKIKFQDEKEVYRIDMFESVCTFVQLVLLELSPKLLL
jgi:hypothetical protein